MEVLDLLILNLLTGVAELARQVHAVKSHLRIPARVSGISYRLISD